ncbi:hypothetical protein HKD42_07445 [Altererythrobacter sp. RZ02]|uniref:Phytase-like domain-containing protein n=1 Tax=Pontixanthobacter rizhaonensis TaxID=2730337 RepID=A0A848QE25_9SPHN|nr:esterase-like activity of phytase family protein [Pontixanthobacter rizhaonensis]NMW31891.1 hypothetical protein [Pontixanthobacter rizhaonensis]
MAAPAINYGQAIHSQPIPSDAVWDVGTQVGELTYVGGTKIEGGKPLFGGVSALRLDAAAKELIALTDRGRFYRMALSENDAGILSGISVTEEGAFEGGLEPEALTRNPFGSGWIVGFEDGCGAYDCSQIHRYPSIKAGSGDLKTDQMRPYEGLAGRKFTNNRGLETLASLPADQDSPAMLIMCGERQPQAGLPNCEVESSGGSQGFSVAPPANMHIASDGVPTDADTDSAGHLYVLFRGFSNDSSPKNGSAIVRLNMRADDFANTAETIAMWGDTAALPSDNFEGLAIREEEGRTFLYVISDDNFDYWGPQDTLLLKFEITG